MTTARAISALALLTASSSALAGAPLGLVALEEATNELVVLPAGEALTMDQTPVAAIFLDEDGLHEVRASPDHMVVDSLFEDPDAWEFEFVAVAGGPPGFIRTAYKPLGFILAIEGGGVEVFVHHPDNPLRVHFTEERLDLVEPLFESYLLYLSSRLQG